MAHICTREQGCFQFHTSCFAKNVPELVRTWLMTLFPESLSATIDFSILPLAYTHRITRQKHKDQNHNTMTSTLPPPLSTEKSSDSPA